MLVETNVTPSVRPTPTAAAPTEILIAARWPVGGIRTHLGYNYPALCEAGYRCTLVVPDDCSLPALRDTLPGAEVVPVPVKGKKCRLWPSIRRLVRSGKYSMLHAHGMIAASHAAVACLGSRIPLVVTLHDPFRPEHFPGLKGQLKRWLMGHILARSTALVAIGDDFRANLVRYFPNLQRHQQRIRMVHNGVDTERFAEPFPADQHRLRSELGLDEHTALLGFLGRFMPQKGFTLLLEALARLQQFGSVPPFHLVAYGSHDYRKEYTRRIEQLGLERLITVRDFVPDVRPILEQLDLLVIPSLWEASPLLPREALAAGVPVLGSDCEGQREVLQDTPARMFRSGDVTALETALREALAEPRFEEAAAYAPTARRRFDNRVAAQRLVAIYDELTHQADDSGRSRHAA